MWFGKYKKAQEDEINELNDIDYTMREVLNNKPIFENIEVSEITTTTATIKVRAIDGDKEKLTYKLYMGTDIDNLEEKDIIQNVEQGIDIELIGTEIDTSNLVYYRVDVIDAYTTVQSQVSTLQNKKPVIERAEIIDITRVTAKAVIKGIDEDGEKLTYKIYYGTEKGGLETTGKIVEKCNIISGTEEILELKDLTLKTKYYYKVVVTDGKQIVHNDGEFITAANNLPVIIPTITKDITIKNRPYTPKENTSWIQVSAKIEDIDNDKVDVKIYLGTSYSLGEEDLIYNKTKVNSRDNSNR